MQGTNYFNFIGRYAWVAEGGKGLEAVVVTERDEPQAVIGSYLHKLAFPDGYDKHRDGERPAARRPSTTAAATCSTSSASDEVLSHPGPRRVPLRRLRRGGFRAFDVAYIDHKGFSERIVTAPVSPLGQRFYVKTKYATAVASPSTLAVDPTRHAAAGERGAEDPPGLRATST